MISNRKYPKQVETSIRGYHIFTTLYLVLAAKALITGQPTWLAIILLSLACLPEILCARYKRRILKRGFVNWRFKVLANSYFHYKGKKTDCILAAPYVSPYMDKMFEIILADKEDLPEVGSMIEICIPGNTKVYELENRYIVGGYYELRSLGVS